MKDQNELNEYLN